MVTDLFILQERLQVFTWIDKIAESNELIRTPVEIKRQLFEMILETYGSEIRDSGKAINITILMSVT